jgi:hypothetical protein
MLQHKFNRAAQDDLATAKRRGLLSPKDKQSLDAIGTKLENHPTANVAIPAATVTTLVSLTLTEGTWLLGGNVNIQCGAAGGPVDVYFQGAAVQSWNIISHQLAVVEMRADAMPLAYAVVAPGATAVVNIQAYANVAMTAVWAMGLQAGSFAGILIRAVRIK